MTKFKVGDRVRPINGTFKWVKGGGVVVPIGEDELNWAGEDTAVRWDGYYYGTNPDNRHYVNSRDLELVTEADPTSPDHYKFGSGVEVIDITRHLDFLTGNAIKYLARAGRKGDRLTDLKKALRYVQWAIEDEEND